MAVDVDLKGVSAIPIRRMLKEGRGGGERIPRCQERVGETPEVS